MFKTIKSKIIFSNLVLIFIALINLMLLVSIYSIKSYYRENLDLMKEIQISWISMEDNLYLAMNRWLSGKKYEEGKKEVENIEKKIDNIFNKNKNSFLATKTLKSELEKVKNLWQHTKKEFILPLFETIDNFVLTEKFLAIESETKLNTMKYDRINYFKKLNLRELIYTNYQEINNPEKSKYISEGIKMFTQLDLLFSASESYTKKVNNILALTENYSDTANKVSFLLVILLIAMQAIIGLLYSIAMGNRISNPIERASNKLINFVGESLERRKTDRSVDEIQKLNDYVNILLNYYIELSGYAKNISLGDTNLNIQPKSENDVMGNAFYNIVEYLKDLTYGANEIINGNYNFRLKERSEKDILAKTYNKLSVSIVELLEKTKEMARLESEVKAAAKIQSSILPRRDENLNGYDVAHISIAATEVGGDNYDFRTTRNGNWISIGDVSGHGLEAGILALIAQSAFNYGAFIFEHEEREHPEVDMYEYVNKTLVLLSTFRAGSYSFMTQNYLFEKNGRFYCAGAHEIGLLYKAKEKHVLELKELSGRVPFMGIVSEVNAIKSKFIFDMEKDDVLVLYSDGLIEAKNGEGEQFDVFRVKEILEKNGEKTPEEIKEAILNELKAFCKDGDLKKYNGSFADDVTILILKRKVN